MKKNKKKVVINEERNKTINMCVWSFAYREARKNIYEQIALDRFRFSNRIKQFENEFSSLFSEEHRSKVYNQLY